MLNSLIKIFGSENQDKENEIDQNLNILCGLMVEAAYTDGDISEEELKKIRLSLTDFFKEDPSEVDKVLEECIGNKNNSNSLYYYTSKINKNFNYEKKLMLIETLWEIVFSDNEIHEYESSLIRRLSGLLYISDIDSGNAKKRANRKIKK